MSRHLCFQESDHPVIDSWEACPTESETSWFRRYQTGGNSSQEALKEFLNILMRVLLEGHKNPEQTKLDCQSALQSLVTEDFLYNGTPHSPDLLCHHLLHLFQTFPHMEVAVNMFRDSSTQTAIFLILVSGNMEGAWINQPATNKHEHLAITIHAEATTDGSKVQKTSFRSEFLSPACYQAIRALDLVFTAFSLHQEKKIEPPIKLVAVLQRKDEPATFEEELKLAEREFRQQQLVSQEDNKNARQVLPRVKNKIIGMVKNQMSLGEGIRDLEKLSDDENADQILQLLQKDKLTPEEQLLLYQKQEKVLQELTGGGGGASYWSRNQKGGGGGGNTDTATMNMSTEEEVLRMMNQNPPPPPALADVLSPLPEQKGGNGYYAAVEQVPVAGQPIYQGYSTCCPPYFTTDGTDYDVNGYPQRGGEDPLTSSSPTLADYFRRAVDRMKSVVSSSKTNVEPIVSQQVRTAMKSIPDAQSPLLRQEGGGVIGSLGTLIFPQGTVATVTPLLLMLGAKLTQQLLTKEKSSSPKKTKKTTKTKMAKTTKKTMVKSRTASRRQLPALTKTSRPLSNAEIRRIMRKKRQSGGCGAMNCGQHLCGDASLRPFGDCTPPTWGPKYF